MGLNDILTVKEVAAYLKTTQQQVRKMILSGKLPAIKIGREWRIQSQQLQELLNSH